MEAACVRSTSMHKLRLLVDGCVRTRAEQWPVAKVGDAALTAGFSQYHQSSPSRHRALELRDALRPFARKTRRARLEEGVIHIGCSVLEALEVVPSSDVVPSMGAVFGMRWVRSRPHFCHGIQVAVTHDDMHTKASECEKSALKLMR